MQKNLENNSLLTNILLSLFSFILAVYFFYGFYNLENSAGAGSFDGDIKNIWRNLNIFKSGIIENLDNIDYNDSRIPLSYILHAKLNPFSSTIDGLRKSVLIISLLVPILFYLSIKKNYKSHSNILIVFLSLIITLSPYFRTSSYWGLGENYAFIFVLISFIILNYFNDEKLDETKNYVVLLLLAFSSSLVVYFDQKLIFLPFIIYTQILISEHSLKSKISITLFYIFFSIPFFYLIFLWQSILPPSATSVRMGKESNEIYHIGYTCSMIAFYFLPFIFFKENWLKVFKSKVYSKNFIYLIFFVILYIILVILFGNFN